MQKNLSSYELCEDGIYRLRGINKVQHKSENYPESGFQQLFRMQKEHFWYLGRHKFILDGLHRSLSEYSPPRKIDVIDLGAGSGGWVEYLRRNNIAGMNISLGDSSNIALQFSKEFLREHTDLYQVDLLHLEWKERWDIIFLLDVIEHIPEDRLAIQNAFKALRPGGKIILTAPALNFFWSMNDVYALHQRRYSKSMITKLAKDNGLHVRDVRYFMFLLSPIYLLYRIRYKFLSTQIRVEEAVKLDQQTPSKIINKILGWIFGMESPLGHRINFPWGTSIYAVLEKNVQEKVRYDYID